MCADQSNSIAEMSDAIVRSIVCQNEEGTNLPGTDVRATSSVTSGDVSAGKEHPSLIVSPDMYPELRDRASEDPWKTWAQRAAEFLESELGDVEPTVDQRESQKIHTEILVSMRPLL